MSDRVLVLNVTYEPLNTVSWQRAVVLVLDGHAEVVTEDECRRIRSERLSLAFPVVVRLLSYVRIPRRGSTPVTRRGVLARDGHRCAYCRRHADTVDHVIPRSRPDGTDTWGNLVAACHACNCRKGNRTPDEAGMQLLVRPYEPRGAASFLLRPGAKAPRQWRRWVEMATGA